MFDDFSEDNDPYEEHDFGSVDWRGNKVVWKIDYYDEKLDCFKDQMSDKCKRLLPSSPRLDGATAGQAVMLVKEY